MSYVYLLKCEEWVKIGYSKDYKKRLKQIQGGLPFEVEVIKTFKFPSSSIALGFEKICHKAMAEIGVKRKLEWFKVSAESAINITNGLKKNLNHRGLLSKVKKNKGFGLFCRKSYFYEYPLAAKARGLILESKDAFKSKFNKIITDNSNISTYQAGEAVRLCHVNSNIKDYQCELIILVAGVLSDYNKGAKTHV